MASLGADGDVYLQKTENTFLGVTSATVAVYVKAAGVWAKVGTDLRGAAWYVNTTSTSSGETRPGDMLLRTDTGDLWQRTESGWGTSIGNLKGATGATGPAGPQGPKGDPGTVENAVPIKGTVEGANIYLKGDGVSAPLNVYGNNVDDKRIAVLKSGSIYSNADANTLYTVGVGDTGTDFAGGSYVLAMKNAATLPSTNPVNGVVAYSQGGVFKVKQADGSTVVPADALPKAGGTLTGATDVKPTSGHPLTAYGSTDPATFFRVTDGGHPYSNSLRSTFYNIGVGDTSAPFGGGVRVLGMQNASTVPTSNPSNGVVAYAQGGVMKVRQSDGQIITVGSPPDLPSGWEPEDLGLKAWAYDPAVSHSVPMYCGTTPRLAAVKLNKRTSISKIVWHFGGYAGGLTSGSWAAIYNASTLVRVGNATTIEAGNEPGEQHGSGGNASATTLDAVVTLDPGVYYVVWRFAYNTTTGDGPMILGIENSYGGPANTFGLNNLWRYGRLTTSPTTSPSPLSGIANESNRFWVALA
ncbi:hypothetical protein ASD97_10135 [Streptomyces sp. Root63]|uniref:hypothetical protein n=1 Tax=unclassified Streptomyces TaxID=2593676 RepID=UPI0006F85116|nr:MULTISPECIES: hypothetical protein [unclassified Streptomyces]KQX36981.1 hypothetical protein ASD29_07095 [Streptomyces sp. Root1295]KRA43957.1 hypothetical protein ASD97_10135 [Streptomyces sp. Root63]